MFLSNRLGIDGAQTAKVIQANESKNLVAKTQHFTLVDAVNLGVRNACDFHDRGERNGEKTAADAEQQSLNTRKSEWRTKLNRCAAVFFRRNVNGPLEPVEDGPNDIHANATARNCRPFGSGAESRFEKMIEQFLIGQALGFCGFQDSFFNGLRPQMSGVDATAVVTDFNDDLSALVIGVEIHGTASGLAGSEALVGWFDTMVNGVADEMHERFGKSIKNALIEIGVLARKTQSHILAALLGNVADDARETPEELLDGNHANFQDALVKLIKDAGLKCHGIREFGAQGITGVLLIEFGKRAIEHGLSDDQFADKVHNRIDAGGVHAERAFGNRGCGGAGSTGIGSCAAPGGLGGPGSKFRRLRIQQIAE